MAKSSLPRTITFWAGQLGIPFNIVRNVVCDSLKKKRIFTLRGWTFLLISTPILNLGVTIINWMR